MEAGLLDEKEFIAWVGISPMDKELNPVNKKREREFSPVKVVDEEGNLKDFYVMSLEGLDPADVLGMRKIQLQYHAEIIMDEHLLPRDRQLSKDQPMKWFNFAKSGHAGEYRLGGLQVNQRSHLPSLSQCLSRASSIIEERQFKENLEVEEQLAAEAAAADDGDGVLDEIDGDEPAGVVHVAAATAESLLGTSLRQSATAKKKPAGRGKKRKGAEEEEEDFQESESGVGASNRMVELAKSDPELAVVAQKHEKITGRTAPKCFESLKMADCFVEGNKVKQAVYGVPRRQGCDNLLMILFFFRIFWYDIIMLYYTIV